jgi:hypothetical protein
MGSRMRRENRNEDAGSFRFSSDKRDGTVKWNRIERQAEMKLLCRFVATLYK